MSKNFRVTLQAAAKLYGTVFGSGGFITALALSGRRRSVFRVPSGSSALDRLLGGGFESMALTEVFGEFRCGEFPSSRVRVSFRMRPFPKLRI